ncbi:MAG: hypothetical protein IPL99_14205 [Candidatus Competibacteraceae bacterium]|nr:hypothetical protein [Candidatus Competibacteraceae bacterium]
MNQSLIFPSAATMEWQRPIYRDPTTLRPEPVCPHCKRKTVERRCLIDDHPVITHHCSEHRDVIPMRSIIVREDFAGVAA